MNTETSLFIFAGTFFAICFGIVVSGIIWSRRFQKKLEADPERKRQHEERIRAGENGLRILIYGGVVVSGFWVFGKQCYTYLRYGEWVPRSVIDLMEMFEVRWAMSPDDWIGLHKVLDWTPMSVALILTGIVLAAFPD